MLFESLVVIQVLETILPKDFQSLPPDDPPTRELRIEPRPQIYIPISSVTTVAQIL